MSSRDNQPIFDDSAVAAAPNALDRTIRKLMVQLNVTYKQFQTRFTRFGASRKWSSARIDVRHATFLSTIKNGNMDLEEFEMALTILGYKLDHIQVTPR